MPYCVSIAIGYLLGMISPSAYFSRRKQVNMKEEGTKNLGASNAVLLLGKGYGAAIMTLDIMKSMLAGYISKLLFPGVAIIGMLAGLGAIVGHVFPAFLDFQGGKGLACYGGMVLLFDQRLFWFYLIFGLGLMLLANRTVVLPLLVMVTFPLIVWLESGSLPMVLVTLLADAVLLWAHRDNFGRVDRGEEVPFRKIVANMFQKSKEKTNRP